MVKIMQGIGALATAALLFAGGARAQGVLETPAAGEVASGIGTVSGWHCTARAVTIRIDAFPALSAGTGTQRNDTAGACGGRTDTGFSLLLNYNVLPTGTHTAVALADGVEFARATFATATLGAEFLRGRSGRRVIRNFPDMNDSLVIEWNEARQNFAIAGAGNGTNLTETPVAGTYYGAAGTQCLTDPQPTMADERLARFDVALSGDLRTMSVQVRYADGFACQLSGPVGTGTMGYVVADATATSCQLGSANLRIEADGLRLRGVLGSAPGGSCPRVFYGAKPFFLE